MKTLSTIIGAALFIQALVGGFSGEYYDPSYGVKKGSLQAIDDDTIDGFFVVKASYPVDEPKVNLDLNGNTNKTDLAVKVKVMLFKKNPAGLDLQETKYNY